MRGSNWWWWCRYTYIVGADGPIHLGHHASSLAPGDAPAGSWQGQVGGARDVQVQGPELHLLGAGEPQLAQHLAHPGRQVPAWARVSAWRWNEIGMRAESESIQATRYRDTFKFNKTLMARWYADTSITLKRVVMLVVMTEVVPARSEGVMRVANANNADATFLWGSEDHQKDKRHLISP